MRTLRLLFLLAVIAGAGTTPGTGTEPPNPIAPIVFEPVAHVRAEVVLTGPGLPGSVGFLDLDGGPGDAPSASIALPWPAGSRLVLQAPGGPDRSGETIHLEAVVQSEGLVLARSARRIPLGGSSSSVWEVYRAQGRRIVLGVKADGRTRPAAASPPVVGRPVAFRLFVERVAGDATSLLETNDLSTFLDEPVAYSFRRGAGIDEEQLRLSLLPVRIVGDVVQVAVDLEARLPGQNAPAPFRRRQTLFATRGVESAITAASGDPPSGYRFRVLAEF